MQFFSPDLQEDSLLDGKAGEFKDLETCYFVKDSTKIMKREKGEEKMLYESRYYTNQLKYFERDSKGYLLVNMIKDHTQLIGLFDADIGRGINCFPAKNSNFSTIQNNIFVYDGKDLIEPFTGSSLTQYSNLELAITKACSMISNDRMLIVN